MLSWNTSDKVGANEWLPAVPRSDRVEDGEDKADFEEDAELELDSEEEADEDDDDEWEALEEKLDSDEPHPRRRPLSDGE